MMTNLIESITTDQWATASSQLDQIQAAALQTLGYSKLNDFLHDQTVRITVVLIHAGNGTRWQDSLAAHPQLAAKYAVDPQNPRGLATVRNVLTSSPANIPMIAYAYAGVQPLLTGPARRHITIHKQPADAPAFHQAAALSATATTTITPPAEQRNQPPGHAAHLIQLVSELKQADIIVTHFGSDPLSTRTLILSCLVMQALLKQSQSVGALLPTAPQGAYPVSVDETGLIRSLQHNKLGQIGTSTSQLVWGGSNIGLRIYQSAELCTVLEAAQQHYLATSHYQLGGGEFSLDHVDAKLAAAGHCRQLAIADPAEATPAKDITQLAAFIAAQQTITKLNQEFADANQL